MFVNCFDWQATKHFLQIAMCAVLKNILSYYSRWQVLVILFLIIKILNVKTRRTSNFIWRRNKHFILWLWFSLVIKDFDYNMFNSLVTWTCLWFHSFDKYIFSASHISNTVLRALGVFCALSDMFSWNNKQTHIKIDNILLLDSVIDYKYWSGEKYLD